MGDGSNSYTIKSGSHWGMFEADVSDGKVVATRPFAKDPNPSPMIETFPSAVHSKVRVTQPMVRKGWLENRADSDRAGRGSEPFVAVSWDEALDLVAGEVDRVRSNHGNDAIYASTGWASAGAFHNAGTQLYRFLNMAGGYVSQVTNYSFGAASIIVPRITGSMDPVVGTITSWPTIRDNTDTMVMFGGMSPKNTQVNMGGLGRHEAVDWLKDVRAGGVDFVNISPLKDDAADVLDAEWLAVRPNTDIALILGLCHTLLTENLHDTAFLDRYAVGFDRFAAYLSGETDGVAKSADWAATITEIDADTIRTLARRMAGGRTLIHASWSVQRQDHGEQPYWGVISLAAMLGQIGLPGGGFGFGYCAINGLGAPRGRIPQPKMSAGDNPVKAYIPVARFADMLLNPGAEFDFNGNRLTYPDIRMVYWCGGNPFHKTQDLNRLLTAWQKPETIVIHEPWWTPAAKRADIVLPCAMTLERNDIGASPFDGFWFAMQKAIEPVGQSRSEYEIYSDLAERLGFRDAFTEGRTEEDWLRHLYDVTRQQVSAEGIEMPSFDQFWADGHIEFPPPDEPPVLFEAFRTDPDANPLKTPSGKIEVFSETIDGFGYDDCAGHASWMEPAEWLGSDDAATYPLHMISNQPRARLHSQLDCGDVSRGAKIADREAIWINESDAAARGIATGDVVKVFNGRGQVLAGAFVTDQIRPGVVQLATGAWFDPDPDDKGLDRHGNPNTLTIDKGTSKLAQCSVAQTALVQIEKADADAIPAVEAFELPDIA